MCLGYTNPELELTINIKANGIATLPKHAPTRPLHLELQLRARPASRSTGSRSSAGPASRAHDASSPVDPVLSATFRPHRARPSPGFSPRRALPARVPRPSASPSLPRNARRSLGRATPASLRSRAADSRAADLQGRLARPAPGGAPPRAPCSRASGRHAVPSPRPSLPQQLQLAPLACARARADRERIGARRLPRAQRSPHASLLHVPPPPAAPSLSGGARAATCLPCTAAALRVHAAPQGVVTRPQIAAGRAACRPWWRPGDKIRRAHSKQTHPRKHAGYAAKVMVPPKTPEGQPRPCGKWPSAPDARGGAGLSDSYDGPRQVLRPAALCYSMGGRPAGLASAS